MSNLSVPSIAVAVLASIAAGGAAGWLATTSSGSRAAEGGSASAAEPGEAARYAELDARIGELQRSIEELREAALSARSAASGSAVEGPAIEAAVARWMAEHGAGAAVAESSEPTPAAAARAQDQRIADAIEKLLDPTLSSREQSALWTEYAKAGLVDALVAEFEKRAELDPTDPDRKVELGNAYLQKLFTGGIVGPEAGVWATKADKAFDAALAIDETHWEARFTKAIALSNWPPFLGRQPEAIRQFEMLIEQQSQMPKQPLFPETHLILGNMYLQIGEKEKAIAAWQAGAALYPEYEEFAKKLQMSGGN
jgi:tetratricopeptide (TPR) repeat protein